jgi:hypothetical protein
MLTTDGADEDAIPRRVAVTTISFSVYLGASVSEAALSAPVLSGDEANEL